MFNRIEFRKFSNFYLVTHPVTKVQWVEYTYSRMLQRMLDFGQCGV